MNAPFMVLMHRPLSQLVIPYILTDRANYFPGKVQCYREDNWHSLVNSLLWRRPFVGELGQRLFGEH